MTPTVEQLESEVAAAFIIAADRLKDARAALDALLTSASLMETYAQLLNARAGPAGPAMTGEALMRATAAIYDTSEPREVGAGILDAIVGPLATLVLEATGPNLTAEQRGELERLASNARRAVDAAEQLDLAAARARHEQRLASL